jgi:hypothetical protein
MYKTRQEAIDAAVANAEDDYIEFDGMNCNDYLDDGDEECGGWDGESRRCDCGNRRVYWETQQQHDGTWMAWAVAY